MSTLCHTSTTQSSYRPPKIEGVSVSVGYADFLAWTLPFNKQHFDKYVIVTSTEDKATQDICNYWNVECIITDVFYEDNSPFNKGKGINVGLSKLSLDGYVVHMDSDIFLPPKTRMILDSVDLHPANIYSIDRLMCKSFSSFIHHLSNPLNQHGPDGIMRLTNFEYGSRLVDTSHEGWLPIGFFQLWCPNVSKVYEYSTEHGTADRSDVLFTKQWPRHNRVLIPELVGIHLESEQLPMGINWSGRKSKLFSL